MKKLIFLFLLSLPVFATCTSPCIAHTFVSGTGFGSIEPAPAMDTTGATMCFVSISGFQMTDGVTDNLGNMWTALTYRQSNPNATGQLSSYIINPITSSNHIVSLNNGACNNCTLEAACFSGGPYIFLGETGTASTMDSSTGQPGSISPPANNLLLTGVAVNLQTISSVNSGFSITDNDSSGAIISGALAYLKQTSATAQNPTWTFGGSSSWTAAIASFSAGGFVSNPTIITVGP